MDVEKIQRINNLAVELQKQGLAKDKEDAVAQAERIFNVEKKTVLSQNSMHGGTLAANSQSLASSDPQSTKNSNLNQEKIEQILEKNTKFLVSTIKDFSAKMQSMQDQIGKLQHRLLNMPRRQAPGRGSMQNQGMPQTNNPQAQFQQQNAQNSQAQPQASQSPAPNKPVPAAHPRSGRFKDTDVSIEKFFYAGNK
ncbi:hypothetical protein HOC01_01160 [archaeon]|jgi:hypothetical protein|nr:hypothetical protein [archaeon]MBT6698071.1 hypothetical protein [archaeon]